MVSLDDLSHYVSAGEMTLLTCNHSSGDVKLSDGVGKGAGCHSKATQDPAQHDRRPAAELPHQHAAERTCGLYIILSLMHTGAEVGRG